MGKKELGLEAEKETEELDLKPEKEDKKVFDALSPGEVFRISEARFLGELPKQDLFTNDSRLYRTRCCDFEFIGMNHSPELNGVCRNCKGQWKGERAARYLDEDGGRGI